MPRLVLVSNRLPLTVKVEHGAIALTPSAGGLATGLGRLHEQTDALWIGWPGDTSRLRPEQLAELDRRLERRRTVPVYLSASEVARHYDGFANEILWPLFHYLVDRLPLGMMDWSAYEGVNRRFADEVSRRYQAGDQIWIHDYQLMLLPGMLRERLPDARIGFFLHIPFPAPDVFRILPWRDEILAGLLGADLIGFHTLGYVRQFASALLHVLGVGVDLDRVRFDGREIRLGAFPMSVDAREFEALAGEEGVRREAEGIRRDGGGERVVVGIDRLDYTKGIPRRLLAIERLLQQEPALRGRLRFIQVAVPTRSRVSEYAAFRDQVNGLVGRINGQYGTPTSVPIHYLVRSLSRPQVAALYRAADVMVVTPLRDGMNLVAKEFVATRSDGDGVLVLSEFAGAAAELGEALLVNPYDMDAVAGAVGRALEMPEEERRARMLALRGRVLAHDVHRWAARFVEELASAGHARVAPGAGLSPRAEIDLVLEEIRRAPRVLWLLDYDGTLVPFAGRPELARPDPALRLLLAELAARPGWAAHIVSGRSRELLEGWFGELPLGLHGEHGLWSRPAAGEAWQIAVDDPGGWKVRVREVLEPLVARVPGSLIEEKTASIAWHYRMADPEYAAWQARELQAHLGLALSNAPVEVVAGDKIVEVRPHGVHKGIIVERLIARAGPGLVVAMGDDRTDEDLFAALPAGAVSIHVGPNASQARYRLPDVRAARALLRAALAGSPYDPGDPAARSRPPA